MDVKIDFDMKYGLNVEEIIRDDEEFTHRRFIIWCYYAMFSTKADYMHSFIVEMKDLQNADLVIDGRAGMPTQEDMQYWSNMEKSKEGFIKWCRENLRLVCDDLFEQDYDFLMENGYFGRFVDGEEDE